MNMHEKIKNFIIDNFLFGEEKGLTDDTPFLEEAIVDSTGILELVSYMETEFSIVIKDEELTPENLDSINKVTNFIKMKKGFETKDHASGEKVKNNNIEIDKLESYQAIA